MAKAGKTRELVEDQTLGGFKRTLRQAAHEARHGKSQLSAVDQAIEQGRINREKREAQKTEEVRFVPLAAGYYGKDYRDIDGKLTKVESNK